MLRRIQLLHTRSCLVCLPVGGSRTNQHLSNHGPRGRLQAGIDRRRQRHHHKRGHRSFANTDHDGGRRLRV